MSKTPLEYGGAFASLASGPLGALGPALTGVLDSGRDVIRWFRGLMTPASATRIMGFVLIFAVAAASGGCGYARTGRDSEAAGAGPVGEEVGLPETPAELGRGDAGKGRVVFEEYCSSCHATDNDESGFAPGLKGVLKKDELPESGRPATVENVLDQLREPVGMMPSFNSITGQDLADLIEYMKGL